MKLLEQNDIQFVYTCSLLSNTPFIRPQNGLKFRNAASSKMMGGHGSNMAGIICPLGPNRVN